MISHAGLSATLLLTVVRVWQLEVTGWCVLCAAAALSHRLIWTKGMLLLCCTDAVYDTGETHSTSSLIGPALRMQRAQVHTPSPKPL